MLPHAKAVHLVLLRQGYDMRRTSGNALNAHVGRPFHRPRDRLLHHHGSPDLAKLAISPADHLPLFGDRHREGAATRDGVYRMHLKCGGTAGSTDNRGSLLPAAVTSCSCQLRAIVTAAHVELPVTCNTLASRESV